jgi:uracil DNA glycosylase
MQDFDYNVIIEWLSFFEENKEEFQKILTELNKLDRKIYPRSKDLLRALFYHPPNDIKLFLLGQDPYIGEADNLPQAMGLSFSVPKKHKKIPPSLQNIFKEIKNSYPDYNIPKHRGEGRKNIIIKCCINCF